MITIHGLSKMYLDWAPSYYRNRDGQPTKTIYNIRDALRELCEAPDPANPGRVIGEMPASEFTAPHLYHVQQHMANKRLARRTVNDRVDWIKRIFEWACSPERELLPEHIATRLRLVKPLKPYRSAAVETPRKLSVSFEAVRATALFASEKLATMMFVQWHTGMRPCEVCMMNRQHIDCRRDVWLFVPQHHKTLHHGKSRFIPLGPSAQAALEKWLPRVTGDWIFPGKNPNSPMNANTYWMLISRLNRRWGLEYWTPRQIRKAFATRVEREFGELDAQLMLDHSNVQTTRNHYIDPNIERKIEIARMLG